MKHINNNKNKIITNKIIYLLKNKNRIKLTLRFKKNLIITQKLDKKWESIQMN
jgi:hypothetical protein